MPSLSQVAPRKVSAIVGISSVKPITRHEMEEIRAVAVKTDKALQTLVSHLLYKGNGKSR